MVEEDTLTAELSQLGIRYFTYGKYDAISQPRPPSQLMAALIRHPSARVRAAVIAVLLAHPEFAVHVPAALQYLSSPERKMLRFFYTAAYLLQQQYACELQRITRSSLSPMPDLFSTQIGLTRAGPPQERLKELALICQRDTNVVINWVGTFEHAAQQLLRRWEAEAAWTM
jgi:hypothetical protein